MIASISNAVRRRRVSAFISDRVLRMPATFAVSQAAAKMGCPYAYESTATITPSALVAVLSGAFQADIPVRKCATWENPILIDVG
jgi:hypothetical protein